MRIDLYGPQNTDSLAQVDNKSSQALNPTFSSGAQKTTTEDTTTLSSGADSVQSFTALALQTTPSRAAKVDALKQSVNNGQYQLDSAKTADALVDAEF